jgi:sterol desaturase/sphingolipid hydroxylase (fatty acid hydroxylase superfamily)
MIGIPLGLIYVNAAEWTIHKYFLHGAGAKKESFWSFQWKEHHRDTRKNSFVDKSYLKPLQGWNAQTKEAASLFLAAVVHIPLFPIAPFFTGAVWYGLANYYRVHKKSHLDPEWAKTHLPWHYDHHMAPNQHANWCVTRPWFDHIMGTREPYVGTEAERSDLERKARRVLKRREKAAGKGEPALI